MDIQHAMNRGFDKLDSLRREAGMPEEGDAPSGDQVARYIDILEGTVAGQEAALLLAQERGRPLKGVPIAA